MSSWSFLFLCSLAASSSMWDTSIPEFEVEGQWWIFESQLDKEEREHDFKELVDNLRIVLLIPPDALDDEHFRLIEWRSLMLVREYLHRSTDVQVISDKIQRFEQFLSSGINMIAILESYEDDVIFKSFLTIMMKTREIMLEIEKYHVQYQTEESRQTMLSKECHEILDSLNNSQRYKDNTGFQELVREVLMWKANFEERHDALLESIKTYSDASGAWFYEALLMGYYSNEDIQNEMGQVMTENEGAAELLEAARALIRTYQEIYTSQENETLEIVHTEL